MNPEPFDLYSIWKIVWAEKNVPQHKLKHRWLTKLQRFFFSVHNIFMKMIINHRYSYAHLSIYLSIYLYLCIHNKWHWLAWVVFFFFFCKCVLFMYWCVFCAMCIAFLWNVLIMITRMPHGTQSKHCTRFVSSIVLEHNMCNNIDRLQVYIIICQMIFSI